MKTRKCVSTDQHFQSNDSDNDRNNIDMNYANDNSSERQQQPKQKKPFIRQMQ